MNSSDEVTANLDVDKVRIREAIGSIRNELQSFLSRRSAALNEAFVRVLVAEHLLLPDKDFAESLLEDDEADEKLLSSLRQSPKLPRTLAKSWSDLLKLMTEQRDLLPQLVRALHDACSDSNPHQVSSLGKDLATAWICEILKSVQNKPAAPSKTNKFKQKTFEKVEAKSDFLKLSFVEYKIDAWQSVFHHVLMDPNERTVSVFPLVSSMMNPPLSQSQEKRIHELMDVLLGRKVGDPTKQVRQKRFGNAKTVIFSSNGAVESVST